MTIQFDRIVIAVPDLPVAMAQYQELMGTVPFIFAAAGGVSVAWWGLPNTVIEMVQRPVARPCIQGIVLCSPEAAEDERAVVNSLGLAVAVGDGRRTADFRRQQLQSQCSGMSVDHLVLRTTDAQACIDLFAGTLGIRLALDKTAPAWGGRMLFFRAGKLTLEVIQSDRDEGTGDFFWGIAYQCSELQQAADTLLGRGVLLSGIRDGRKPGTRVATVKSHCVDIPTLLIEPAE